MAVELTIPDAIVGSRALAEAHRLDLALFVALEDASLRTARALTRRASDRDALDLATRQALDDARHHELLGARLDAALAAALPDRGQAPEALLVRGPQGRRDGDPPPRREDVTGAAVIPPLRRVLGRCHDLAEAGSFVEALALLDLVLKAMAGPVYAYAARSWEPVDPCLAGLIRAVADDEARHVAGATQAVRARLGSDPGRRARVAALCAAAHRTLHEVFRYYIRKLVGLFAAVAGEHGGRCARDQAGPGRPLPYAPEGGQVAAIQAAGGAAYARAWAQAGLYEHGR
jgi:hypothetical protein